MYLMRVYEIVKVRPGTIYDCGVCGDLITGNLKYFCPRRRRRALNGTPFAALLRNFFRFNNRNAEIFFCAAAAAPQTVFPSPPYWGIFFDLIHQNCNFFRKKAPCKTGAAHCCVVPASHGAWKSRLPVLRLHDQKSVVIIRFAAICAARHQCDVNENEDQRDQSISRSCRMNGGKSRNSTSAMMLQFVPS